MRRRNFAPRPPDRRLRPPADAAAGCAPAARGRSAGCRRAPSVRAAAARGKGTRYRREGRQALTASGSRASAPPALAGSPSPAAPPPLPPPRPRRRLHRSGLLADEPLHRLAVIACALGEQALQPLIDELVPGRLLRRFLLASSRRHRAGRAPSSWRRRAAGDTPRARPCARGPWPPRCARASLPPAGQTIWPTSSGGTPCRASRWMLAPWRLGSMQVSGRNTIGACRPLAPCTVMMRTSSRFCSMSRLISTSVERMRVDEALQRRRRLPGRSRAQGRGTRRSPRPLQVRAG